jgi:hypothetical protein
MTSWEDANLVICSDVESSMGWGCTMKLNTLCLLEVAKWLNALIAGLPTHLRAELKFKKFVAEWK